jgi:hypothetical protein
MISIHKCSREVFACFFKITEKMGLFTRRFDLFGFLKMETGPQLRDPVSKRNQTEISGITVFWW